VVLNSCLADDGYYRTQTYLRGKVGGYLYAGGPCFVQCLATVTDGCAGVRACLGLSDRQSSDACDSCQDNVAIVCGDAQVRWDCSKVDGTCQAGRCTPNGRASCDQLGFTDHCDAEGRPTHCDDLLQVGPPCASFGLECREETFSAWCVGTGGACPPGDWPYFDVYYTGQSCNGDRLNACVRGGLAELDCALFGDGFTCQSSGGRFFCGIAAECDPETYAKSCDGNTLVFCSAGKLTHVDCTALGFTTCDIDPDLSCR